MIRKTHSSLIFETSIFLKIQIVSVYYRFYGIRNTSKTLENWYDFVQNLIYTSVIDTK